MAFSFDDALKRLQSGEAIDSVLVALRPEAEVAVQRGAAAVRHFDRETFALFGTGATPFESFVKQPLVEAVPGTAGNYRIRDDQRGVLLQTWTGSEEWRNLNARLAAHFHARAGGDSIDELFHLIALGPSHEDAALAMFERLFAAADDRFDLAACAELLDVVGDPSRPTLPKLLAAAGHRRCRLRARQLWSEEYFRTTAYQERPGMREALDALVSDPVRRMLQVYGGGGLGKTMFIRWTLARYLVPRGLAVARLDFDFEEPAWLADRPWRLALKIARQLNEQLPAAPFTEMVKEYGDAEAEEDQSSGDHAQDLRRARTYDNRYNDEAFARFNASLMDAAPELPPVIICDTLERVSLYQPQEVLSLIRRFASLGQGPAAVRLILAGRYDLDEHLPGFSEGFGGQARPIRVAPFAPEEARIYLTQRRGLAPGDRVEAIIDRSAGVPFKLALFATIVQEDDALDAAAIRAMPNVNVEYLIKRVVDHIKEPLAQWVLRHGVVPRQLTRAFLRDVMLRRLVDIQRGDRTLDSGEDRQIRDELRAIERFRRGLPVPADAAGIDTLWGALNRYASDYSWISQSKEWPDTLVFHADVVDAMRFLLQDQPIFRELHEDAIRYYQERAAADEGQWVRWTCEALYHQFQRGGPDGPDAWRAALARAAGQGDPAARRAIAEEILRSEYVDDTSAPRRRQNGEPMVPAALLPLAHFEAARARIDEARLRHVPATDQLWMLGARRLADAERLDAALPATLLPRGRLAMLKAAYELQRQPEKARQMLDSARAEIPPDAISEFEELYGDAVWPRDMAAASRHYRAAVEAVPAPQANEPRTIALTLKLADAAANNGDHAGAVDAARRALSAAEAVADAAGAGAARVRLTESLLVQGRLRAAIKIARESSGEALPLPEVMRATLNSLDVRARVLEGDPLRAWRHARRHFRRAFDEQIDADATFTDATGLELKAELHAEFFEFEAALLAWREARRAWDVLRRPELSLRCVTDCVRTMLRETRELILAGQMMSEAERTAASLGGDAALSFRVLEAERIAATDRKRAGPILDGVLDTPGLTTIYSPDTGAAAAMQALVMAHREDRAKELLVAVLSRVTPPAARLKLLEPRVRPVTPPPGVVNAIRPLLMEAVDAVQHGRQRPGALHLDALEVLRWMGERERALQWLRDLASDLDNRTFTILALREIAHRLGAEGKRDLLDKSLTRRFLQHFVDRPRVRGVFLLSEAEIRAAQEHRAPVDDTVARIEGLLGDAATRPASLQARLAALQQPRRTAAESAAAAPKTVPAGAAPVPAPPTAASPVAGEAPVLRIAFGRRDDRSEIDDGRTPVPRPLGDTFAALAGGRIEELTQRGLVVPLGAARRLASDPRTGADIARLLCDEDLLRHLPGPTDLRIETSHSMFGAIPWELAQTAAGTLVAETPPIRCLYRSATRDVSSHAIVASAQSALQRALDTKVVSDGRLGPQTTAMVRKFQEQQRLLPTGLLDPHTLSALGGARREAGRWAPPAVVILERGVAAQRREVRGSAAVGFTMEAAYRAAGWDATVVRDPTRNDLRKALRATNARVLHVSTNIGESSRLGGLYLDLGHDIQYERSSKERVAEEVRRAEGLSITDLIDSLPTGSIGIPPLLVLDPPFIPSRSEAARQLLLRNAFASDLFQLGVVPAIIATGLVETSLAPDIGGELARGLSAGGALPAIGAAMRRAAGPATPGPTPLARAIAVFAHYADYSPWPSLNR